MPDKSLPPVNVWSAWDSTLKQEGGSPPFPETIQPALMAPMFMPTFMKALEVINGLLPSVSIEAKNSTFVDSVFKNKVLRNSLFNMALMLSSSVVELIDRKKNPRVYETLKFVRNVLALEKFRKEVKDKFVVHGGSNLDDWNHIVKSIMPESAGSSQQGMGGIDYVPPGLTDVGTFVTALGCNAVQPSTYYAMYRCDVDHKAIDVPVRAASISILDMLPLSRKTCRLESIYRYGPDIQMVTESNGSMKFIMAKANQQFCWLQVFKVTMLDDKGNRSEYASPYYLVMYTPVFNPKQSTSGVDMPDTGFVQQVLIDKFLEKNILQFNELVERRRNTVQNVGQAFLKKMKFSMFDPETSIIGMSNIFGANDANNARFYARLTYYSGKDAVHVLPEYDTIRDALGKCLEMGRSRGYAFVGSPGTGKTIMMNQLINEFPSAPVVTFSMQGFTSIDSSKSQPTLLYSIVDVVQSLADAGFTKIFLCCDDIDSVDMSTKNTPAENLISLLDGLHARLDRSTSVIFMCTVNDPSKMHSTIIKRGKRIDEVIEVPCPNVDTIRRLINSLKDKGDPTDYTEPQFTPAIERMASNKFSLADLSTMMTNLQIYGSPDESGKFTPETLDTAIGRIELSKENAAKTYES